MLQLSLPKDPAQWALALLLIPFKLTYLIMWNVILPAMGLRNQMGAVFMWAAYIAVGAALVELII